MVSVDRFECLARVAKAYGGSDGDATKALYADLAPKGPLGVIATNLFRANKNSERAKVYRGGGYRGMAYDRKQWAMGNLAEALVEHGEVCGINWGWSTDPEQVFHHIVLYIDLPTGQVSFHTNIRAAGPTYLGKWDGVRGVSSGRIVQFVADVLGSDLVVVGQEDA